MTDDDDLARDLALADDDTGHADAVSGMDDARSAAILEAATIYRHARSADDSPPRLIDDDDDDTRDRGEGGGEGRLDADDDADQSASGLAVERRRQQCHPQSAIVERVRRSESTRPTRRPAAAQRCLPTGHVRFETLSTPTSVGNPESLPARQGSDVGR